MKRKPQKKKLRMTKGKAFALCLAAIVLVFASMFALGVKRNDPEIIPVSACLKSIEVLAGMYIVGSIANNVGKGLAWNQDMYDSENKLEVKR